MTELERRALLGDRQAQEECSRQGVLLPCPFCGNTNIRTSNWGMWRCWCPKCGAKSDDCLRERDAIRQWNVRPAPPIGRCGECKHSTNPAALTMIYGEPGTLTCHHGPCNRRNVNENDFCSYFEPKEEK